MQRSKKKHRIRIIKAPLDSPYAYHVAAHDNRVKYLIGWPGYRTSNNKSGLGYMETRAEWAHMQGVMLHLMLRGKFKTRNPVYFFMISVIGIFLASPVLIFLTPEGKYIFLQNWVTFLPYTSLGILMLINAFLNLISCKKGESITGS